MCACAGSRETAFTYAISAAGWSTQLAALAGRGSCPAAAAAGRPAQGPAPGLVVGRLWRQPQLWLPLLQGVCGRARAGEELPEGHGRECPAADEPAQQRGRTQGKEGRKGSGNVPEVEGGKEGGLVVYCSLMFFSTLRRGCGERMTSAMGVKSEIIQVNQTSASTR